VTLKYVVLELPNVEITIFKHLLAHAVELSIDVIPPFDQSELELILVSVGIGVVSPMRAPVNEVKPQPINKPILFKADYDAIALLLGLYQRYLLKLVPNDFGVSSPNEEINLSEIKDPIEDTEIVLL
jgi:hypothetical protein